jgi:hypothetical protein
MNRRQFLQTTRMATAAMPFLTSAFASPARAIRTDHDGMLCVRSQREFILGLYQAPKRKGALRQASEAEFNLINRSATHAAYDEAQALGLWGWSALGSLPPTNRSEAETRMRTAAAQINDTAAFIRMLNATHPPAHRIGLELLPAHRHQPINAFPKIHRLDGHQQPHLRHYRDHAGALQKAWTSPTQSQRT